VESIIQRAVTDLAELVSASEGVMVPEGALVAIEAALRASETSLQPSSGGLPNPIELIERATHRIRGILFAFLPAGVPPDRLDLMASSISRVVAQCHLDVAESLLVQTNDELERRRRRSN
jgi:hypothetical protein